MTNKKKTRMYMMTPEVAETFYRLCTKLNATTEEERHRVLDAMARLGLMKNVIETGRTREEIVRDMRKHYKVLDIREKNGGDTK